ncbi:MAG: histidine kinase [Bacteroidia bacterium]|nr:histidine kinase [Bacteroidia bacterium]
MNNAQNIDWNQSWFVKYKLYHFLFWAVYHFTWGLTQFTFEECIEMLFHSPRWMVYISYVLITSLGVLFCIYVLWPRFLERGKPILFLLSLFLTMIVCSQILVSAYYMAAFVSGESLDFFCYEPTARPNFFYFITTHTFPSCAASLMLGICIKLGKSWLQSRKSQQILEKEKLEVELDFLRNQFNPHFLFNTINSIFFLINKNPKEASNALAQFSDLLRYQLYECNVPLIHLSREISYLRNFVALEKLRKNKDFQLKLELNYSPENAFGISSFVLIAFVENAFKHVSKSAEELNWVSICLFVDERGKLEFVVKNSKEEGEEERAAVGGIGLQNVKRRLELVYPGKYELEIHESGDRYEIRLELELEELKSEEVFLQPLPAIQ